MPRASTFEELVAEEGGMDLPADDDSLHPDEDLGECEWDGDCPEKATGVRDTAHGDLPCCEEHMKAPLDEDEDDPDPG